MLSRMKMELKDLEDPPDDKFLSAIALTKQEYNGIRKLNNQIRKKGAMSVHVVSNADQIVLQALGYLTSRDPNLLYSALLVVTGLRPIEIVKMAEFSTKLNNSQGEKSAGGRARPGLLSGGLWKVDTISVETAVFWRRFG